MKKRKMPKADIDTIMDILISQWRRLMKKGGPQDHLQTREFRSVVNAIKNFTIDWRKDLHQLGAYLLYYWPIRYQQGLALINELPQPPRRVLDVSSGCAPFAFAALRHGANDVIALDDNFSTLEIGAKICGQYGLPLSIRKKDVEGQFDLIIMGYCLDEGFVKKMLQKLTPDGYLLIVDDSSMSTNQRVLKLRNSLVEEGYPIQAPCVWRGACPALQNQSPCYAQRPMEKPFLIKEIQRAANINLSSLKMSYLIVRNRNAPWPQLEKKELYRIISPPVTTFRGQRYHLCGTDGKKTLEGQEGISKAFDHLQRGELISIENALLQKNSYTIDKESTLKVEASLSKPLIEVQDA